MTNVEQMLAEKQWQSSKFHDQWNRGNKASGDSRLEEQCYNLVYGFIEQ